MVLPTVTVRFENLSVDTSVYVGARALPTTINAYRNTVEVRARRLIADSGHLIAMKSTQMPGERCRAAAACLRRGPALAPCYTQPPATPGRVTQKE